MLGEKAIREDTCELVEARLLRGVGRAIAEHGLIEEGDHLLVAVSGGKDSYGLLSILRTLQRRSPVRFQLTAVNVDQGHPGYRAHLLVDYMAREQISFRMIHEDTYSIVKEKVSEGKTYCSLCSRLRRGILYRVASEIGCNKVALGHHREDVLNTLLLNMFFAGQLGAMPARLLANKGKHTVIRPLVYCPEADLRAYAEFKQFPILPCNLCGSQENLKRKRVAALLDQLEAEHPGTKHVMLGAVQNVHGTHLLDPKLVPYECKTVERAAMTEIAVNSSATVSAMWSDEEHGTKRETQGSRRLAIVE
jgi:tRNA 2-thiocytidine biosynthesis protein TtcA